MTTEDLPLFAASKPKHDPAPRPRFPVGKCGRVWRRLLEATSDDPVSPLGLDRVEYGLDGARNLREARRAQPFLKRGLRVCSREVPTGKGKPYTCFWCEPTHKATGE